jgi:hypothetical protein
MSNLTFSPDHFAIALATMWTIYAGLHVGGSSHSLWSRQDGSNLIERIAWLKPVAGLALVVIGLKLAYDCFRQ